MVRKIKIEKRCKKKKMKQRRFTNKKLIALMLPLAVDQLLNSFMGTVDTLVVSNLGSAAISAVSLVDSINILVVQAFFALASGGTVVCSHYLPPPKSFGTQAKASFYKEDFHSMILRRFWYQAWFQKLLVWRYLL